MASAKAPAIEVTIKRRNTCQHSKKERIEAATVPSLCPICVFSDRIGETISEKVFPMRPAFNDLPEPPSPSLVWKKVGFFGLDIETLESKLAHAKYEGQHEMWGKFMEALYPKTRANPKQEDERG